MNKCHYFYATNKLRTYYFFLYTNSWFSPHRSSKPTFAHLKPTYVAAEERKQKKSEKQNSSFYSYHIRLYIHATKNQGKQQQQHQPSQPDFRSASAGQALVSSYIHTILSRSANSDVQFCSSAVQGRLETRARPFFQSRRDRIERCASCESCEKWSFPITWRLRIVSTTRILYIHSGEYLWKSFARRWWWWCCDPPQS